MKTTVLVVVLVLSAGMCGCDLGGGSDAARLLVGFNQDPVVVLAGEVVTVRADVSGGTAPFVFEWEWTGDYDYGYGEGPTFRVTPPAQFVGSAQYIIHVRVTDHLGQVAVAEKLVTVGTPTSPSTVPVANNQTVAVPYQTATPITLIGSGISGAVISYVVVTNPAHGALSGTAPSLTYTPNTGYSGPDSFTFKVNDRVQDSNTATVSITVSGPTVRMPTVTLITTPSEGRVPLTVAFLADTSFDTRYPITGYQWDFDDGSAVVSTGVTPGVSHLYSYIGSYTPKVRITDSLGRTVESTGLVIVDP
jgi:PKD repeat protein